MNVLLNYLQLEGSLRQQATEFLPKAKQYPRRTSINYEVFSFHPYPFRNKEQIMVKYHTLQLVTITKLPNYFAKRRVTVLLYESE